jgi:hypothetical protein
MTLCDRCTKAPATTYMEYRESSDEPHWRNRAASRCTDCAKSLREYVAVVRGFALVIDRSLETGAPAESLNTTAKES